MATDVGGGTSYSMLRTLDEGYKVLQLRGQRLTRCGLLLDRPSAMPRRWALDDRIGTLAPGTEADIVVLDARATPQMALRLETVESLAEELFLLQTLRRRPGGGRDLCAGRAMKCRRPEAPA